MEPLNNLKPILHSKRANLFYLEHCRVQQKDGRVVFLTQQEKKAQYWNIPIANTTFILLGTGTSITQAAVRMLASAGVTIGFSGGGGTPLLASSEIEWLTPQSEYRPTEYVQGWLKFWFADDARLAAAKQLQRARIKYLERVWSSDRELQKHTIHCDDLEIEEAILLYNRRIGDALSVFHLLQGEGAFTKALYKYVAQRTGDSDFVRERTADDAANRFLNHGNYLAYGIAASALWVLGIPHGFAVMHGKTRRGALVFDAADLIKDAIVLPRAFVSAHQNESEKDFRASCLRAFADHHAMDYIFDTFKTLALSGPLRGALPS